VKSQPETASCLRAILMVYGRQLVTLVLSLSAHADSCYDGSQTFPYDVEFPELKFLMLGETSPCQRLYFLAATPKLQKLYIIQAAGGFN